MPDTRELIDSVKDDIKQLEAETGKSPSMGEVSDLIDMEWEKHDVILTPTEKSLVLGKLGQEYEPSMPDSCGGSFVLLLEDPRTKEWGAKTYDESGELYLYDDWESAKEYGEESEHPYDIARLCPRRPRRR